jgi:transposase
MPRPRRAFTAEFKAQVVLQLLRGDISQAELCRKHNITASLLANWKAIVLQNLPALFDAESNSGQNRDEKRIAELEQLIGKQAYELDLLKKASRLLSGPSPRNGRS